MLCVQSSCTHHLCTGKTVLGLLRALIRPFITHAGQNMYHRDGNRASDRINWSCSAGIHRVMLIFITEVDGPARSEQQGWLCFYSGSLYTPTPPVSRGLPWFKAAEPSGSVWKRQIWKCEQNLYSSEAALDVCKKLWDLEQPAAKDEQFYYDVIGAMPFNDLHIPWVRSSADKSWENWTDLCLLKISWSKPTLCHLMKSLLSLFSLHLPLVIKICFINKLSLITAPEQWSTLPSGALSETSARGLFQRV